MIAIHIHCNSRINGTAPATFKDFDEAIDRLGLDEYRKFQIYRILAGIYALGKIEFQAADSGEGCILTQSSEKSIAFAAKLLSIDHAHLLMVLTTRKIGENQNVISYVINKIHLKKIQDQYFFSLKINIKYFVAFR